MLILRRHFLPAEDDSEQSLARAKWLQKRLQSDHEVIIANAIARAFGGS